MKTAYIIDAVRTPIGKYGGSLSSVRSDDLAALVIKSLLERNPKLPNDKIEDVILGCTNQAGEDSRNVARMALLLAGLPVDTGGVTINRLCASGMQAVIDASRAVKLDEGDIFIAGGTESMSRAPWVVRKSETPFGRNAQIFDSTIGWRFTNPKLAEMYYPYSMGETAENVAEKWNISRQEQDEFALSSQKKYKTAFEHGKFKEEIIPLEIPQRKKESLIVSVDEHPRPDVSIEQLAKLKAAFKKGGTVTAGSSSGINDGASAMIVASEDIVNRYDLKPKVKILSSAVAGVDPALMGTGPIPATRKALKRAGLTIEDLDLIELNEAFAAQSIACIRDLNINPDIVNVNGGAIALGHPLGCSGARIITTLYHEMCKRDNVKYGLATLCIGVGQGASMIFEKV